MIALLILMFGELLTHITATGVTINVTPESLEDYGDAGTGKADESKECPWSWQKFTDF